ncbi:MAG: NHLP bacteriocin system secretion protein [Rhodobacteraceae bacterium]|nr:NHLP bacteriocin system secretion protein [Paracoccaceae bacterium]
MPDQASVEKLTTPDQLDKLLTVTRPVTWLGMMALVAVLVGGVGWAAIVRVPVNVQAAGILITPSGLFDVVSGSGGRIVQLDVSPGSFVREGQQIGTLAQADLERSVIATGARLDEARHQLERLKDFILREQAVRADFMAARRDALRQTVEFAEQRIAGLRERLENEMEMVAKDLMLRQRPIDTQSEINDALETLSLSKAEETQLLIEEETLQIETERSLLTQEAKVADLALDLQSRVEELQRQSSLTSPYSGRVLELKVNRGEVVEPGAALFSLLPQDEAAPDPAPAAGALPLVAYLYAAPSEGKKVRPGMVARISPSTVKPEQYGYVIGRVRAIAEVPSTGRGMQRVLRNPKLVEQLSAEAAPFEIIVDLEHDPATESGYRWSSSGGPPETLSTGTLALADIQISDVMLLGLALPVVNEIPWLEDRAAGGVSP